MTPGDVRSLTLAEYRVFRADFDAYTKAAAAAAKEQHGGR